MLFSNIFKTVSPARAFQGKVLPQELEEVRIPGVLAVLDHSHPMADQLHGLHSLPAHSHKPTISSSNCYWHSRKML